MQLNSFGQIPEPSFLEGESLISPVKYIGQPLESSSALDFLQPRFTII